MAAAATIASSSSHVGDDYGLARILEALRPAVPGASAGKFAGGQVDLAKAFIASGRIVPRSRSSSVVYSVLLHALILSTVILLPLWFTNALDLRTFTRTLLVAPPPPPAAPHPPVIGTVAHAATHRAFIVQGKLVAPTSIPKEITMLKEAPLAPEIEVTGGVLGGVSGGLLSGLGGISAVTPSAPPPPAAEKPREPLRVGGNVRPPRAIFSPSPEYPPLARMARISGEVLIDSIIDIQGNVVEMEVVSGPALLYGAALKALATWKFEPTYLNGEPTPIHMKVTVKFHITG
jgi:periplasmic protein TonB